MSKKYIKKEKQVVKYIILLLTIIVCGLAIKNRFSTFQTDKEKQLKPVYKATMKDISGFNLDYVWLDEENNSVRFGFQQKKYIGSNEFTKKELESIYKAIVQLEEYLNDNKEFENLYTKYSLEFQLGNITVSLYCQVEYINKQATFYYLDNTTSNYITDYYMMKSVHVISMDGDFTTVFEKENIDKLVELENLEKIYFSSGRDEEIVEEFTVLMKDIKPECKIYHDGEEVLISN